MFYHGKHYCFYFHLLTVEIASKIASVQVLFNSITLYVITLTEPLTWIVINEEIEIDS